jgi:3-hydroxyisobutyrate dehydrogenase-like beta-hydroxyacid dehydrogenase
MGEAIASNLLRAGYGLRVYNRTASKAAPLVAKGATLATSPADVAHAGGIVLTMLSDDKAVEECCFPSGSFVEKLGAGGVHVSLSTIGPGTARKLAEHHAKFKVDYVASPVFGRPDSAAAARLWVIVSGAPEAKKRIQPILTIIGQGVFDFGEDAGGANVVKLCGNFLIAAAIEAIAESLALAEKNGLNKKDVAELFGKTLFASPIYQGYGRQIVERRFEPAGFRLALGLKDITLAQEAATTSDMPMPLATFLRYRWLSGVTKGRENLDWSAVALGIAEEAGLK